MLFISSLISVRQSVTTLRVAEMPTAKINRLTTDASYRVGIIGQLTDRALNKKLPWREERDILWQIGQITRDTWEDEQDHQPDADLDRCECGGQVVFFEDGDHRGKVGEGCEVLGLVWYQRGTMKYPS